MSSDESRTWRAGLAALSIAIPLAACTGEVEPSIASLSDAELIDIVEAEPDMELTMQALAERGCAATGAWSIERESVWSNTVFLVREGVCVDAASDQQRRSTLVAFVVDDPRGAVGYGLFSDAIEVVDPAGGASHFERENVLIAHAEGELTERTLDEDAALIGEAAVGTSSAPLTDVGASRAAVCDSGELAKALFYGYDPDPSKYGGGCPAMTDCSDCRSAVTVTFNEIDRQESAFGQSTAILQMFDEAAGVGNTGGIMSAICGQLSLTPEIACRAGNQLACLQKAVINAGDGEGPGCLAAFRYKLDQYFRIRAAEAAENNPAGTWQWWLCSNDDYGPPLCESNCHGDQGSCAGNINGPGGNNDCLAEEIDGDGEQNGQVPCCTLLCDSFCLHGDEAGSSDGWSNDDTADASMCVDLSGG